MFGIPLDALLAEIYGIVARAIERAGRSYLASGYFAAAATASRARSRGGRATTRSHRLLGYARGMGAYLAGDYAAQRAPSPRGPTRGARARLAAAGSRAAVSSIAVLAQGDDGANHRARRRVCSKASRGCAAPPVARASGCDGRPPSQSWK